MAAFVKCSKTNSFDRALKYISVNLLSAKWVFFFGFFQGSLYMLSLRVLMFLLHGWWAMTTDLIFGESSVNESEVFTRFFFFNFI